MGTNLLQGGVSENVSEKPEVHKRGRPAAFEPVWMNKLKNLFPEITTQRGRLNRAYAQRAIGVLMDDPAYEYLCSTQEKINQGVGGLRFAILNELGRVTSDDDLRTIAAEVCRRKLKSREAVHYIRRLRTGKEPPGGALGLTKAIIDTVNHYLARHPSTTWQMVTAALENAHDLVEESRKAEQTSGRS